MAKKKVAAKKINKSQLIRDFKASHPDDGPKAIAEALSKKHGVEFTPASVSTILTQAKKKSGGKSSVTKKSAKSGGSMISAAEHVKSAGGFAQARKQLDELEAVSKLLR